MLNNGPTFRVDIGVTMGLEFVIIAGGGTPPAPVAGHALVDTGASGSVVRQGIPGQLGLNPVGVVPVMTATTGTAAVTMPTYAVRFVLPNSITFEAVAIEANLGPQQIDAILGRDILRAAVFVYNGTTDSYTIAV